MNLFKNISAGLLRFVISSAVGFIVLGLLARHLSTESLGLVILATNLNHYFALTVMVFTSTAARFSAISYFSKKYQLASEEISSAIFCIVSIGTLSIAGLILVFILFQNSFIELVISNKQLFYLSVCAFFFSSLSSVINAGAFIAQKIFWADIAEIIGKISLLAFVFTMINFTEITPNLYGLSIFLSTAVTLTISYFFLSRLKLNLNLSISRIKITSVKRLFHSGKYALINTTGVMLYTVTDIAIITYYSGVTKTALYGATVQYVLILPLIGVLLTKIIEPKIALMVSQSDDKALSKFLQNAIETISSLNSIFLILLVLVSGFIFPIWLGDTSYFDPKLIIILLINQFLHLSTAPIFTYLLMTDRLKHPAFITILVGLFNILFSIFLIKYTLLDYYGPALASFVAISIKTVWYNVYYAKKVLPIDAIAIWLVVFRGASICAICGGAYLLITSIFQVSASIQLTTYISVFIIAIFSNIAAVSPSKRRRLFDFVKSER